MALAPETSVRNGVAPPGRVAPYIVGVGGGLRAGSSTERAVRFALACAERAGARTLLISGEDLDLPLYSTEAAGSHPGALRLTAELARADGILLGSPSYHGSISGVMKNALDYAEGLRSDARPYFSGRAVGCVATAGGWPGAVHTLGVLRDIVHALRGWPTPMGVAINASEPGFDATGECADPRTAKGLECMALEVLGFVHATKSLATEKR